jgi:hypothetical protein
MVDALKNLYFHIDVLFYRLIFSNWWMRLKVYVNNL